MKEFLIDILTDPLTGDALIYDKEKKILYTKNKSGSYAIINDVPVILTKTSATAASRLHTDANTGFNYADHYQKDAEAYDYFSNNVIKATKKEIERLHEAVIESVPPGAKLILDAGCGNGWLANYFIKKNRQVISMDISTINPLKALQNNPVENHAALTADVFELPFKKNSIDCIVASEIMEHVPDPKLFVKKLMEPLRPGGKLVITTPYNEKIEYYLCVHCNLPTPRNAHLHSFNKENIKTIVEGNDAHWKAKTFANKYLIKSRLNLLLGFLPFSVWKFFDSSVNIIFNSPSRLIIEIIKKQVSLNE